MDLEKLLEKFEKLVYHLLVLIILIPKTLIQLIRHTNFSRDYVQKQFDLGENERFKDYVSPVLFVIFFLIVPFHFIKPPNPDQAEDSFSELLPSLSSQDLILLYSILVSFIPIFIATCILIYKHVEVNYENLKRPFYSLLYIYSYIGISLYPLVIRTAVASRVSPNVIGVLNIISFISLSLGFFQASNALRYFYKEELREANLGPLILILITYFCMIAVGLFIFFLLWLFGYEETS